MKKNSSRHLGSSQADTSLFKEAFSWIQNCEKVAKYTENVWGLDS